MMTNEIKEIYLNNLEWIKTHDNDIKVNDNMGSVIGNIFFKDNMSYEEFQKLFKSGYFILCDKDYITNLQEENERLKNLYTNEKNHKIDYNYFKVLYSKADKGIIIEDLVYKCEQCRVLYDNAEKKSIENYNLLYQIDKANQLIEKHKRKDGFLNLNEWQTRDLLNTLRGDK